VLDGRRVVVVGASSGIGRAAAVHAAREGANLVVAARRGDRLAELVDEIGTGSAVATDVSEAEDCARLSETVQRELGEIDLVLHTAAMSPLKRLADTSAEDWHRVLATNVVGVQNVITALLPHLAMNGIIGVLSSETIGQQRAGLGAYSASKAALEESLRCWHAEYPGIRFSCVAVGSTVPTEFGNAFDLELLTELMAEWALHGLAQAEFMDSDELGEFLVRMYAAALPFPQVNIEHLLVRSPSGLMPTAQKLIDHAEATIPRS